MRSGPCEREEGRHQIVYLLNTTTMQTACVRPTSSTLSSMPAPPTTQQKRASLRSNTNTVHVGRQATPHTQQLCASTSISSSMSAPSAAYLNGIPDIQQLAGLPPTPIAPPIVHHSAAVGPRLWHMNTNGHFRIHVCSFTTRGPHC